MNTEVIEKTEDKNIGQLIEIDKFNDLLQPLKFVLSAMGNDKIRQVLCCLKVQKNRVFATDGRRLHIYNAETIEPGQYKVNKNLKNNIQLLKVDSGNYPNIDRVIPSDFDHTSNVKSNCFNYFCYKVITGTKTPFNLEFLKDIYQGNIEQMEYKVDDESSNEMQIIEPLMFSSLDNAYQAVLMPMKRP